MTNDKSGSSNRRFGRRSVLLGAGGTAIGISGIASAAGVLGEKDSKNRTTDSKGSDGDFETSATQFQGTYHNEAVLWDYDMDMAFTNRMRLVSDPADGDREGVVHITSGGDESQDYAVSGIDLRAENLTLADVSSDGAITYDYYKGEQASYRVPDEVFLILQRADGGIAVTYRKEDTDQDEQWHTRDVSSEFSQDDWRAFEVDASDIDLEDEQVRVTAEVIGNNIMALREQDYYSGVVDRFGEDTSVLAIAIGNGSVDGTISDAYFNNIQVLDTAYTVPATVSMDAEFSTPAASQGQGGGRVSISLSFMQDQHEVSVDDIDPDSVRMTPYSPFAPPIPGTNAGGVVRATNARVSGSTLEAGFPPGQVRQLGAGNQPMTVLVFGAFEGEPHRFVAVGELNGV